MNYILYKARRQSKKKSLSITFHQRYLIIFLLTIPFSPLIFIRPHGTHCSGPLLESKAWLLPFFIIILFFFIIPLLLKTHLALLHFFYAGAFLAAVFSSILSSSSNLMRSLSAFLAFYSFSLATFSAFLFMLSASFLSTARHLTFSFLRFSILVWSSHFFYSLSSCSLFLCKYFC